MITIKKIRYVESLGDYIDVITQLDWEYSEDGYQTIGGTLILPNPTEWEYISINDITEENLINWVNKLIDFNLLQLEKLETILPPIVIKEITLDTLNTLNNKHLKLWEEQILLNQWLLF